MSMLSNLNSTSMDSPEFLDRIVQAWEASPGTASALAVCQDMPALWERPGLVVKLAYEEFRIRSHQGDTIVASEFCRQFGDCGDGVRRMLSVHLAMAENPSLLENLTLDIDVPEIEWPQAGDEFLRFEIKREIGRGGLARVYLAQEQAVGNRLVVLKLSTRDSGEARIMGRLQHPGIMPIHHVDFDPATGFHVVVMPFLGTTTLFDVLNRAFPTRQGDVPSDVEFVRKLAEDGRAGCETPILAGRSFFDVPSGSYLDAVLEIGIQLAEALAYTHARGVLHRDLKPSNILLAPQGIALLMDFNLSARTDGPGLLVGGTVPYMPPELLSALSGSGSVRLTSSLPPFGSTWNTISGEECVTNDVRDASTNREFGGWIACADPRSDIFSWGVILYEMLTGQLPFAEPDARQPVKWQAEWVLKRQIDRPLQRNSVNQHIPENVFLLIQRCLAVESEIRPATAQQVVEALSEMRSASATAQAKRNAAGLTSVVSRAMTESAGEIALASASNQPRAVRHTHAAEWRRPALFAAGIVVAIAALAVSLSERRSPASGSLPRPNRNDPGQALEGEGAAALRQSANELMSQCRWAEALVKLQYGLQAGDAAGPNYALQAFCTLNDKLYHGGGHFSRLALDANYKTVASHNNYGFALLKTRRLEMARKQLQAALDAAPDHPVVGHNMAMLEFAEGNAEQAINRLRTVISQQSDPSAELWWDAALALVATNRPWEEIEAEVRVYVERAIAAGLETEHQSGAPQPLRELIETLGSPKEHSTSDDSPAPAFRSRRLIYPLH